MKKLYTLYLLFFCLFIWYANSSNPPNGRTGAPGDDACTSCHTAGESDFTGAVSLTGLPNDILPNTTYNLTVTTNFSSGSPSRAGFQMLVLDGADSNIGTFSNFGVSTETEERNGRQYLEHRPAKSFGNNTDVSWTADWTSPASATNNEIKVYINSIIGDGSGTSGDLMVSTQPTFSLMEEVVLPPIATQISNQQEVSCFNGMDGQATVTASGGDNNFSYQWSNGVGQATASNLSAGSYEVTITDGTGTSSTSTVTISQPSELALSISNIMDRNCTNDNGSAMAQASGGTAPYTYNWSNNSTAQSVSLAVGMHSVTVTDTNGCNNTVQVSISDERQTPIAVAGADISIDCSAANTMSTQLNATGSSSGENITYNWTTTNGNILSGETTLTPIVNASGTYLLNVEDGSSACSSTDEVTVIFAPMTNCSSGNISGKIIGADGTPLSNIEVNIDNQSVRTSSDGSYSVEGIPFQSVPAISASKLDGITEMVSTFDLVLITKHILSSELLDSPLKRLAADVNASGSISTFDIVLIRKVILGIDTEFPDNTSWRFIPANFNVSNETTLSDIPTNITINNFTSNQINQDFIGIKMGDVSYDAVGGFRNDVSEKRSKQVLLLEIPSNPFEAGTIIESPIHFPNLKEFIGFQLELNFDPSLLQFDKLTANDFPKLETANISYQHVEEGKILMSWVDTEQSHYSGNINLKFFTKKTGNLKDAIWLDNQYLKTEAYTRGMQIEEVFFSQVVPTNSYETTVEVYPNPTSDFLVIKVPKNQAVIQEISLFNNFGRKVKTIVAPNIEANTFTMLLDDISAGTYFTVLTSRESTVMKKILVVK